MRKSSSGIFFSDSDSNNENAPIKIISTVKQEQDKKPVTKPIIIKPTSQNRQKSCSVK